MSRWNTDRLKLELRRARVPALQYLFVLACALFVLGIFFKNQLFDRPWVSKRTVHAQFADVKGVTPGAQRVRIAGVDVGLITGSELGKDGRPVLTLKIDEKYGKIYKDASMRLRPLTPLQDLYVDIDSRGTPAAGELTESDVLKNTRTTSPVDVSRVLNVFDRDTRERMQQFFTQFGRGLDDRGAQLRQTFVQLAPFLQAAQRTTGAMAERRRDLAHLVHNLGRLTEALATRDRQLTRLVSTGNATMAEIARVQRPLDRTLAELPPLLGVMRSSFAALRAAEGELDPALRSLEPVADKLDSGLTGLQRFAQDARPALSALREPLRELAPLSRDLRPTARSTEQAFNRLAPLAPKLDRITADLPPCFDTMSRFFNNTLSVTKFYDGYSAMVRGENEFDGDAVFGRTPALDLRRAPRCTDGRRKTDP
jgi:virulence factor Mce-like protein